MATKKKALGRYDYIRIVNPEIVVRWGYPLNKQIVKDTIITDQQRNDILTMLKSFGIIAKDKSWYDELNLEYNPKENPIYEKVLDEIAYGILKSKRFGGKERQIFTERKDFLKGARAYINERKIIKTGVYNPAHNYQGYFDAWPEYEPAYLSGEETHVLYRVDVSPLDAPEIIHSEESGFWIEKKNVERYE